MNAFDVHILLFLNGFAHRCWTLDAILTTISFNHLYKGGMFLAVLCFVWFQSTAKTEEIREKHQILLYTLFICVPGLLFAREAAAILPFRERPLFESGLNLRHAFTLDATGLDGWSSFPSDHAVLFFALATGVFLVSRRAGWFLYFYAAFLICLPRIFLGFHYPTDVLAGALFGSALGYSARWSAWRSPIVGPAVRLQEASPGIFYAAFFLLVYQTAVLYDPLRATVSVAHEIVLALLHS
jgi:undecaprenyl-diphosphatase